MNHNRGSCDQVNHNIRSSWKLLADLLEYAVVSRDLVYLKKINERISRLGPDRIIDILLMKPNITQGLNLLWLVNNFPRIPHIDWLLDFSFTKNDLIQFLNQGIIPSEELLLFLIEFSTVPNLRLALEPLRPEALSANIMHLAIAQRKISMVKILVEHGLRVDMSIHNLRPSKFKDKLIALLD